MSFRTQLRYYAETRPWEALAIYGEYKQMQQPDKLLLGFKGRSDGKKVILDMNQPVYIDFDVKNDSPPALTVLGRKGCLLPEERIYTRDRGYVPIIDVREGDSVLSYGKGTDTRYFHYMWDKVKTKYEYAVNEELYKITLENGIQLTMTSCHPLLIQGKSIMSGKLGEKIGKEKDYWATADKLSVGDVIHPARVHKNKCAPPLLQDRLTSAEARLLAMVIADGHLHKHSGRFVDGRGCEYNGTKVRSEFKKNDPELLAVYESDFLEVFGKLPSLEQCKDNCVRLQNTSQAIQKWFADREIPIGSKSTKVRIPSIVMQSSENIKRTFLSALFSCDGSVYGNVIEYCTVSSQLSRDVALLLSELGIRCSVMKRSGGSRKLHWSDVYRLNVDRRDCMKFAKEIGFLCSAKQDKADAIGNTGQKKSKHRHSTKIVAIEKVHYCGNVYDIEMPRHHSFACNGIISHNSGKTSFVANLIDQMFFNFGVKVFVIDPKASFYAHKFQQQDSEYIKFLEKSNIPIHGLPLRVFTPKFLKSGKYKYTDQYYSINMSDINSIEEFSFRRQMMESLLGIAGNDGSIRKLNAILELDPKSFAEMQEGMEKVNARNPYFRRIAVFDTNLKSRLNDGIIGDEPTPDIVAEMQRSIVVLQCSLSTTEEFSHTYIAFALAQLKNGFEAGKFKGQKVAIVVDEADVLDPKDPMNPVSKPFLKQAYTKWRSDGAIPIFLSQDPSQMDSTPLAQSDYVFTPRTGYGTPDSELISRLFPAVNVWTLSQLHYGDQGSYPKEWACINSNQEVVSFYPYYSPHMTDPSKVSDFVPQALEQGKPSLELKF